MAKRSKALAPSPVAKNADGTDVQVWTPPDSDQEFVFESIDAAPAWVDKGWAGFDRGPALQVPAGLLDDGGNGPYHTKTARVGDKVVFTAAKGAYPARLDVIAGELDPKEGGSTRKPPQASACSLEDALRTGAMTVEDMAEDAKAQVAARTPSLGRMIENGQGAPEPQAIGDLVKLV